MVMSSIFLISTWQEVYRFATFNVADMAITCGCGTDYFDGLLRNQPINNKRLTSADKISRYFCKLYFYEFKGDIMKILLANPLEHCRSRSDDRHCQILHKFGTAIMVYEVVWHKYVVDEAEIDGRNFVSKAC